MLLLLCCFLAVRGLVPAGFMPAPLSLSGLAPYDLCSGDARSALLLDALAQGEHSHHAGESHDNLHNHDDATAQAFADNHCGFSASAGLAMAPVFDIPQLAGSIAQPPAVPSLGLPWQRNYLQPPQRAPPVFPIA